MEATTMTQDAEISEIKTEIETSVAAYALIEVKDDDAYKTASDVLSEIKKKIKDVEAKRQSIVKPLNDHVKFLNGLFSPLDEKLTAVKKTIESKMLAYSTAKRKEAEEAERKRRAEEAAKLEAERKKLEAAAKRTKDETKADEKREAAAAIAEQAAAVVAAPVVVNTTVAAGSSTIRKDWTYEIEDISIIPREFLQLNGPALMAAIRAGSRQIAGVRIFQKETIISR